VATAKGRQVKAARYDRTGPASEVLRVAEVARPEPGAGQVRVRLALSGVNPTDVKSRGGLTPRPIEGFQIPHHDGAGVIDAVGAEVDPARIGERVWVWFAAVGQPWGTAAQWAVVPAARAVPLPDGALFELGACLGVPAMTAHRCLFADGPVEDRAVLVAGGAGAVGHYAIELAKFSGARVVATVSNEHKAELARQAGADEVVNYRDADAIDQVRKFAEQVDRIVEVDLGANLDLGLAVSGPETVVVTYASTPQDPLLPVRRCMTANVTLRFVLLYNVPQSALSRATQDISQALAASALTELPLHRFPLDGIVAAHEAVESGVTGKVVLDIP
jgi:NADPH:quinone reductase